MTKKEQKEYEEFKVLQELVSRYNIRLKVHLHEREELQREHDYLEKKINKLLERAKKDEGEVGSDNS